MTFASGASSWTLLFLALCIAALAAARFIYGYRRHLPRQAPPGPASAAPPDESVLVAFASQSGFAASIAWQTAGLLHKSGVPVTLAELGSLDAARIASARRALFIVSTTGNGEAPDGARAFMRGAMRGKIDLRGLHYALLALGDRSYDDYCAFGHALDRWLRNAGATPQAQLIEVDNADGGALQRWQQGLASFGSNQQPGALPRRYFRWKLARRSLLNPGSPGGPVFHVVLAPVDTPPLWSAGDIAEVFPGPAHLAFASEPDRSHREYTVASLPADGGLELVVRRVRHADGRDGVGSDWLTRRTVPGELIAVHVRANRAFHAPPDDRPMILIGNGTGIAGLRAHLKARAAAGRHRNWLIFGERTAAHDWLFRDEIDAWRRAGHIARLDLAFSRDQTGKIYVQHRLAAAADAARAWIDGGASIHVCGSLKGMAGGVTETLGAILGQDRLEQLIAAGRYCRDVY